MTEAKRSMRSPLGRVRNNGASGAGTGHFISQRVTSIALALLAPWFAIAAALAMRDGAYLSALDFVDEPINAIGLILLVVIGLHHMSLGMQEVILDYIAKPFTKVALLVLNAFVPLLLGAGAIFAVLLVNFGKG